jgi:hypothetical protein
LWREQELSCCNDFESDLRTRLIPFYYPERTNQLKIESFRTYLHKSDLSEMIANLAKQESFTAYHVTTLYPKAETPKAATACLKRAVPYIFNKIVHPNWRRGNACDAFYLFSFLDEPGSRYRPQDRPIPIESVQDSFHHHSILLAHPEIARRINRKVPWVTNPNLPPIDPIKLAAYRLQGSGLRSCHIQHLPTLDDIARTTRYASKSTLRLSAFYYDESFIIFPLFQTSNQIRM